MPAYQEIPRPGRPRGSDQENILQMYRYQHRLAELIETAINTIGDAGDRNIEQTAQVERIQREEKERVNQLKSTTRVLNTTIQQTNAELNLKAPQEDVDDLKEQVSLAGIRIDEANAKISLKASQTEVDGLSGRVSQAEILIDGANAAIELKASQTEVDGLSGRVSQAEILIDGANAAIELKASQTEVDGLSGRVSQAEILIDGANAAIELKASQATVDGLEGRLSQAEVDIDGANASIALKASQATADALGQRVSSAEVLIDGANAAIELKASKDDLDSVSLRLDAQAKTIEAKADIVRVEAIETEIAGLVRVDQLSAQVVKVVGESHFGRLSADAISAEGSISAQNVSTGRVTTDTLNVGGLMYSSHSHDVTVDGGTVTLGEVSSTGGSFNMADTTFFKDAVSAAKKEGQDEGYELGYADAKPTGLSIKSSTYNSSSKAYSVDVEVLTADEQGYHYYIGVGAESAYNAGYADAEVTDISLGSASYVSEYKVYQFPVTVTSANGATTSETFGISAQSAYDAGYAGAEPRSISATSVNYISASKLYSVTATVESADGATTSFQMYFSASAAYDAGYSAGQAAGGGSTSVTITNTSIGSDNLLNVYAIDNSTGSILSSKTIDVTSVYTRGYEAAKDAVVVTCGVTSWSNPAQYYAQVRIWGKATIDGEEVGYASASDAKNISGYV